MDKKFRCDNMIENQIELKLNENKNLLNMKM